MTQFGISRRNALQLIGAATGATFLPGEGVLAQRPSADPRFLFCLNTATIREQNLGLVKELEIISKAGFEGAEIWIDSLEKYINGGGTVSSLKKRIDDLGITIEDAIGFEQWIVDDDNARHKGLEKLRRQLDLLAAIGCRRIAAPPAGATSKAGLSLKKAAERYRAILEMGEKAGVVPQLELWGFSANLNKLSDVAYVAIESGHPKAKVLLDNYHLYKGGSNIDSLHLLDPSAVDIFHVNDYPDIPADRITDADRVLPGEGISPLKKVLSILGNPSRKLVLSVEIFNKEYYKQDALDVAKLALEKLKSVV